MNSVVESIVAAFNRGAERDAFFSAYDPEVVLHGFPAGLNGMVGVRRFYATLWEAFPDAFLTLQDTITEADRVAVRYEFGGTQLGAYLGSAPTGKAVSVSSVTVVRFVGERIAEEWHAPTELSILAAIGAIEMPHLTGEGEDPSRRLPPRHSAAADAAVLRWMEQHPDEDP
jgi:predicted ester cyclase